MTSDSDNTGATGSANPKTHTSPDKTAPETQTSPMAASLSTLAWTAWATRSPYAPQNLGHLRAPQPRDATPHDASTPHDADLFTWSDALEDLLAVARDGTAPNGPSKNDSKNESQTDSRQTDSRQMGAQGQVPQGPGQAPQKATADGLPDIAAKAAQRRLLRQVFPHGEPPGFWVQRLQAQGLLPRADRLDRGLDGPEGVLGWLGRGGPWSGHHPWTYVGGILESFPEVVDAFLEAPRRNVSDQRGGSPGHAGSWTFGPFFTPPADRQDKDPWDPLGLWEDAWSDEGVRSLTALVESLQGQTRGPWADTRSTARSEPAVEGRARIREQVDEREYVDDRGLVHRRRTVCYLDSQGREVGRSTVHTACPPAGGGRTHNGSADDAHPTEDQGDAAQDRERPQDHHERRTLWSWRK